MEIDYKKEVQDMIENEKVAKEDKRVDGFPWWRPPVGVTKFSVTLIGKEYHRTYSDKQVTKVRLEIKTGEENFNWGVNKGGGAKSIWGQLMIIGAAFGDIKNRELTLVITESGEGDNKRRNYVILEAAELMSNKDDKKDG